MSLLALQVPDDLLGVILGHLATHNPTCRNMHMRQPKTVKGQRTLRWLHAMWIGPDGRSVWGCASGPGCYWLYELVQGPVGTVIHVYDEDAPPEEKERFADRFEQDIRHRIAEEKEMAESGKFFPPPRTPGQLYLKRKRSGGSPSSQAATYGVSSGQLCQDFVDWVIYAQFELILG